MSNPDHQPNIQAIGGMFDIPGEFVAGGHYGTGHINDTFAITYQHNGQLHRYILQRVNDYIFKDAVALMANVSRVTRHVRRRLEESGVGDVERRTLTLVPTKDGADFIYNGDGRLWRTYLFIDNAQSYDTLTDPRQAFEAARAFGRFQKLLTDLPPPRLNETIKDFHNTRWRLAIFKKAVEEDCSNRAREVKDEIEFALSHADLADSLLNLVDCGELVERTTHNDTKINNVLLDDATGEGLCVLDLDTVMPGLSLYDFGDMVRSASCKADEDEIDLSKIKVDVPLFKALTKGYLSGFAGGLLPVERANLTVAGKLLTYECGIRFLSDYLDGDKYFKITRPGHNRDRCRTQFALVRSLEDHEEKLQHWIAGLSEADVEHV